MKELENIVKLSVDIQKMLVSIMTTKEHNPEECLYALNIVYVGLFISACRYKHEYYAEHPDHFEQRMIAHLQLCFDEAKKEIIDAAKKETETQT